MQKSELAKDFGRIGLRHSFPIRLAQFPFIRDQLNTYSHPLKILDIGCGPGWLPLFCKANNNFLWFGIELWESEIQQAADKKSYSGLVQGNLIDTLPFKTESFDVVVCGEVLMYLPHPDNNLLEFRRVLKPGGILFLYEPICLCPGLSRELKLFFRKFRRSKNGYQFDQANGNWRQSQRPLRITYHSKHTLTRRVQMNGFQIEKLAGFRLFRRPVTPLKKLENFYFYYCLTTYIAGQFPGFATDLLVQAQKINQKTIH